MVKVVTVGDPDTTSAPTTSGPAELRLSDVEATIDLVEYDFAMSDRFDGDGRVLVTNSGEQTHVLAIFRIGETGTYEEFVAIVSRDDWVDPSLYPGYGGIAPIDPGVEAIRRVASGTG